jgi:hypothetical protein
MFKSQERVRGMRLSEVVLLALTLATLVCVLLPARSASAVPPSAADYRLQGKLSTSVGTAPALQKIGPETNSFTTATVDGASRKVLTFPKGNGLKIAPTTGVISNGTYTIVVLFELNNVGDDVSRFRRVVDFENGTSDSGLYIEKPAVGSSILSFYRQGQGTVPHLNSTPIAANKYVQVVITRDDASGFVKGYVDGTKQFEINDATSQDAVISSANTLRFFKDNTSEHSGGSVARIRLFDSALSETDVGRLDRLEPTIFTVNSNADLASSSNLVDGKCLTVNPNECTLRAAIQQARATAGADIINFSSTVSGTITLTQGHLSISDDPDSDKDVTINGPGARKLTVSGNNASRVFFIADDASAAINNLKIRGGQASNGGGISNDGDFLALTNSTVSGNTATGAGGGIYNSGNALTLSKTTVSGNKSDGSGGILNGTGSSLTITNSTVSGNEVTFNGGGIFNNGGTMTLTNSTISNNIAGGSGGGLVNNGGSSILRNTIVANNTSDMQPDVNGTFSSQGNNLVGNTSGAVGFGGSDVLNVAPLLGPLQNNGGPTDTRALLSDSPAIDRGTNTNCPATDQRGVTRPRDGDGNGRARCDMGAYEKN